MPWQVAAAAAGPAGSSWAAAATQAARLGTAARWKAGVQSQALSVSSVATLASTRRRRSADRSASRGHSVAASTSSSSCDAVHAGQAGAPPGASAASSCRLMRSASASSATSGWAAQ